MSLSSPHPIWTTCGNNPFEVHKAIIQARFLSGRYRCDSLVSHFSPGNSPQCSICTEKSIGSIEHILLHCSSLQPSRTQLLKNLKSSTTISDQSKQIINHYFTLPTKLNVQLLLDCSVLPEVISLNDNNIKEEIFRFTRTWCYSMHRRRLQLQGKWIHKN